MKKYIVIALLGLLATSCQDVYEKAYEAYLNSYSPYSKFKVGACLLMKNGEYII